MEGVVTSKMVLSSSNIEVQAQLVMIGDINSITYFKKNNTRTENSNPITGESINIIDSKTQTSLTILNNPMVGKQYATNSIEPIKEDL